MTLYNISIDYFLGSFCHWPHVLAAWWWMISWLYSPFHLTIFRWTRWGNLILLQVNRNWQIWKRVYRTHSLLVFLLIAVRLWIRYQHS